MANPQQRKTGRIKRWRDKLKQRNERARNISQKLGSSRRDLPDNRGDGGGGGGAGGI